MENFPGIMTLGLLEKIQSLMRDLQCEPEHFKDRIIFMSIHDDIKVLSAIHQEVLDLGIYAIMRGPPRIKCPIG